MNTYIVWIEMDLAKVFKVSGNGKSSRVLHRHEIKHHTSRDPENHKNCEKFFHEITESIADASEILLIGPGLAKDHFKVHLERHHHEGLLNKVIGTKTMDLVSDPELMAYSRKFFKQYDVFETVNHA